MIISYHICSGLRILSRITLILYKCICTNAQLSMDRGQMATEWLWSRK